MKRILIVEDDQIFANIYGNRFRVEGFQVEFARDGLAGLEMVRTFRPDAVILDLVLPRMTGVELMKKIRSEPDFQQVPVIVLSNAHLTSMMQQAWKAGATKCLSKSNCTPEQVIDAVRDALANRDVPAAAPPFLVEAPGPIRTLAATSFSPPAANGAASRNADKEFEDSLRTSFIEGLPATLAVMRTLLRGLIRAETETARLNQVQELYRRIHSVAGNAGIVGMPHIARMADSLEALLKELCEKPKNITASVLRTVASGIDFLGALFEQRGALDRLESSPPTVLVVDDEAISRRALTYALEKAKLKSVNVADPNVAYDLLAETNFDLIFLDVDMPGMSGYELCAKLRQLPAHRKTPVVFVTSLTDFESRANSTMSGGTDFIAKPFQFIELAVKALVCVLRGRLQAAK
jgi:CheY-like chemotaxis protein/HPt (histidine-containing phosphotransfer) domain-containing protein